MIVEDRDRKIEELRNTGEDVDVLVRSLPFKQKAAYPFFLLFSIMIELEKGADTSNSKDYVFLKF